MKEPIAILLSITALLVFCGFATVTVIEAQKELQIQATVAAYTDNGMASDSTSITAEPITAENILPFIYVALVIGGIVILIKMIKDGHIVTVFIVGIALLAAWFFIAGDKTGDGIGDSQIIAAVQPIGDQPETDAAYSEINKTNSTANVISAGTFLIYTLAFIAIVLGLGFSFFLKK